MAVIKPFREKYALNASILEFTPPSGRAAIVKGIGCYTSQNGFATIKSANTTVGFFEIGGDERNHLRMPTDNWRTGSILEQMEKMGIPVDIPVPEGEKFVIQCDCTPFFLCVRYQEVDPGDIKPDMPNAKNGKEMARILYGTNSADITSSGWYRLDKSLNPPEMHNWPFEEVANPFDTIEVHAIGILDVQHNEYDSANSADHFSQTTRTRIWKGTEVLFHPDEDGFYTWGGGAASGSTNTAYGKGNNELPYVGPQQNSRLFVFPEPVVFSKGEEMAVEVYCDVDGKIPAETLRAALFCKVVRG